MDFSLAFPWGGEELGPPHIPHIPGDGVGHAGPAARAALTLDLPSQVPLCRPDLGRGEEVLRPGRVQPPAGLRPRGGMSHRKPPSGPPVGGDGLPHSPPTGWRRAAGLMDEGPRLPRPETRGVQGQAPTLQGALFRGRLRSSPVAGRGSPSSAPRARRWEEPAWSPGSPAPSQLPSAGTRAAGPSALTPGSCLEGEAALGSSSSERLVVGINTVTQVCSRAPLPPQRAVLGSPEISGSTPWGQGSRGLPLNFLWGHVHCRSELSASTASRLCVSWRTCRALAFHLFS